MNRLKLNQLDNIPDGLLDILPQQLYEILPQPSLIHLSGQIDPPLFISVLLHGNEITGLLAVQSLLKKYRSRSLPRSVSIFFGNIEAARYQSRRLESQPDYNRIWPGTELPECAETDVTRSVVAEMSRRGVFASIDVHNNTGLNPHYACVNVLDNRFLQLANLFSRLVVYFVRPKGVLSAAFAPYCPSVTLECGKPGQSFGVQHALDYLDTCLHLTHLPNDSITASHMDLFHTVAQVSIPENISFSFRQENVMLRLDGDLDHMNFTEIPKGTVLGKLKSPAGPPVIAQDEWGKKVTDKYFHYEHNECLFKKKVMPSMLTLDENIIRQDCLCYIMERIAL